MPHQQAAVQAPHLVDEIGATEISGASLLLHWVLRRYVGVGLPSVDPPEPVVVGQLSMMSTVAANVTTIFWAARVPHEFLLSPRRGRCG